MGMSLEVEGADQDPPTTTKHPIATTGCLQEGCNNPEGWWVHMDFANGSGKESTKMTGAHGTNNDWRILWARLSKKMQKSKGGEPLLGLFSRPKRGVKRSSGLGSWVCGVVGAVWVWVCVGGSSWRWFLGVFLFLCPLGVPWFRSRGGSCTTSRLCTSPPWALGKNSRPTFLLAHFCGEWLTLLSTCHFSPCLSAGGGGFSAAPSPPLVTPAQNICHRLVTSPILTLVTKVTFLTLGVPIFHPG